MTRIFISYSSRERAEALSLQRWLEDNGWQDDVFLDVDPDHGLAGGAAWRSALRDAAGRCEAVILLLSRAWIASKACWSEFVLAEKYGKPCIPVRIDEGLPIDAMPPEISNSYQVIDRITVPESEFEIRLKRALEIAGAGPENFSLPPGRRPYPGLQPLNERDAALFFGRDSEVLAALDALREMRSTGRRRMLVILGASGAGKSSLLRAGIWPRLNRDDRHFIALPVIRPAHQVLTGKQGLWLSVETACADIRRERHFPADAARTRAALKAQVDRDPAALADIFAELKRAGARSLGETGDQLPSVVLAIDQAEELFNAEGTIEADQLLKLLDSLWNRDPDLLLILAIRSDVYPRLQADTRIGQDQIRPFNLPPMPPSGLVRVVEGPADRVGLELDPQLSTALLEDARGGDALPLLAFTLERLYEGRMESKALRLADYRQLGGVRGAIEAAADQARKAAQGLGLVGPSLDSLLRRTFLPNLARINEAGEFARRVADFREFDPDCLQLIDVLVAQRLLVVDQREDTRTVEIAHEAILREWPLLSGWLDAERGFLEWREQVGRARLQYERGQGDLLTGRALLISQGFVDARRNLIGDDVRAFIEEASAAESRRLAEAEAVKESQRQAEIEAAKTREEAALAAAAAEKKLADSAQASSRRMRVVALAMLALAVGAGGAGYLAYRNGSIAREAAVQERKAREVATSARSEAEKAALRAETERNRAQMEAQRAELAARQERKAREHATQAQKTAQEAATRAERAARLEREAKERATAAQSRAEEETRRAEREADRATKERTNAVAAALRAEQARLESESRRLAVLAEDVRQRDEDDKALALAWLALPHQNSLTTRAVTHEAASSIYKRRIDPLRKISKHVQTSLSPNGDMSISITTDGIAELWDTSSRVVLAKYENVLVFDDPEKRSAWFVLGGTALLVLHRDDTLRLWSIEARRKIAEYEVLKKESFSYVYVSKDGNRVFIVRPNRRAEILNLRAPGHVVRMRMPNAHFTEDTSDKPEFYGGTFSNTGRYFLAFLVAGRAGVIELWNAETGQRIAELPNDGGVAGADTIEFSRNDELLLISPNGRDVTLWDTRSGKLKRTFKDIFDGWKITNFSGDDKSAIGLKDGAVVTVSLSGIDRKAFGTSAQEIRLSADKALAITTTFDEAVIWNVEAGMERARLRPADGTLMAVAISPNGKLAMTRSEGGMARLWDVERARPIWSTEMKDGQEGGLRFDVSGRFAIFEDHVGWDKDKPEDAVAHILRLDADKPVSVAIGSPVRRVAFSGDGKSIFTTGDDGKLNLVSATTGRILATFEAHADAIPDHHSVPERGLLLTGSWDRTAKLWDLVGWRMLAMLEGHRSGISTVRIGPAGQWLATGSHDGTARLWSMSGSSRPDLRHTLEVTTSSVSVVRFDPRGDRLATATLSGELMIWDVVGGRRLFTLGGHDGAVLAIAYSPDGKRLASVSEDRSIRIWRSDTGELLHKIVGHGGPVYDISWSTDGGSFLTGSSDKTARLWDASAGKQKLLLSGANDAIRRVAFSPDGNTALALSDDRALRIWDLQTGALLAMHVAHHKVVHDFAVSADGRSAATSSGDRTVQIWKVFPGTLQQRIAEVEKKFADVWPLTAADCQQYRVREATGAGHVCQTTEPPSRRTEAPRPVR